MVAGEVNVAGGRSGKGSCGQMDSAHCSGLAMAARSIIGLCNVLASQWVSKSSGSPQNRYVIVVEICASSCSGKRVRRPSSAAWAALSVTPGLNPIIMAKSGFSGNISGTSSRLLFTVPCSMMGSVNKSWRLCSSCSADSFAFT